MVIRKHPIASPQSFATTGMRDDDEDPNVQAAVNAARQAAFTASVETFSLLAGLPDAYLRSQRRELKRLTRIAGDDDVRITVMRESIRQAGRLSATAKLGQHRVERMLVAMTSDELLVHGFVSNDAFEPIHRLLVQLTIYGISANHVLIESTDIDGYFRFRTGIKSRASIPVAKDVKVGLSDEVAEALSRANAKPEASAPAAEAAAPAGRQVLGRLQILDPTGKTTLHVDPYPMRIENDSVYREYVLVDGKGRGDHEVQNIAAGTEKQEHNAPERPAAATRKAQGAKPASKPRGKP
jgi:hypothetical protein